MANPHVTPESVEIGDFRIDGGHLTTRVKVALCGRTENLILFVEPLGDEIGVEVCDAILDLSSLTIVAERVAAKLKALHERALLKQAAGKTRNRRGTTLLLLG